MIVYWDCAYCMSPFPAEDDGKIREFCTPRCKRLQEKDEASELHASWRRDDENTRTCIPLGSGGFMRKRLGSAEE